MTLTLHFLFCAPALLLVFLALVFPLHPQESGGPAVLRLAPVFLPGKDHRLTQTERFDPEAG